ncbi:MAG: TIGR03986 family CRISPR-associated RAMP protein [Subdoligranulum sp.]|nr:TIGR03986 family CRISPR-associated RAMP protein [Subdoligranulum sp.]
MAKMPKDTTVCAPYNFVPFSSRVLAYTEEIPAHNDTDPALKTGEIHLTLTAQTPVFVSDGKKDANGRSDAHFFRGPDGKFQIPGSTIRGMVRQNMQILGFGLVRLGEDMQNQRVLYREIAGASDSTGGDLRKYYHNALGVEPRKGSDGKNASIPQRVEAGYLCREEDGSCYIRPVKGKYIRVSKKILAMEGLDGCHAMTVPVRYTANDNMATAVYRDDGSAGGQRGILLCPGLDTGGDGTRTDRRTGKPCLPAHRYIFPPADADAAPVSISGEDALAYEADWESRKNSLRGGKYDPDFWKLPERGEEKPVFYIQYDGHVFFGMSLFPRIGYRFSLEHGLPKRHREQQKNAEFLDWPRAILGWAGEKTSWRSRVSFGNFFPQGQPAEMPDVTVTPGGPKISYYPGYVREGKHYNMEDFQLRGYKQYWLKDVDPKMITNDKANMASKLRPLPAGTRFSGVIRYKNLRPEELGLLLWSIRLEEDCCQSVGMGKPYGYGRMKVTIDALREYDAAALYCPENLCAAPAAAPSGAVQAYIDAYDAAAAKALEVKKPKEKPSIISMREIQDFFYLKKTVCRGEKALQEVRYMTLEDYQNVGRPLPSTTDLRKKAEEEARAAQAQDDSPEAKLLRMANRHQTNSQRPGKKARR